MRSIWQRDRAVTWLENDFEDLSDRIFPGPDLDVPAHNGNSGATIVAIADIGAVRHNVEMAFAWRILQRPAKGLLRFHPERLPHRDHCHRTAWPRQLRRPSPSGGQSRRLCLMGRV